MHTLHAQTLLRTSARQLSANLASLSYSYVAMIAAVAAVAAAAVAAAAVAAVATLMIAY
jgi:hypothetical protein